jgi:hypothetical protein
MTVVPGGSAQIWQVVESGGHVITQGGGGVTGMQQGGGGAVGALGGRLMTFVMVTVTCCFWS